MIQLVGPGGSGKTTIGSALAAQLQVPFVDLDAEFTARQGDISGYLNTYGYAAYGARNVSVYTELVATLDDSAVLALSSGFMTYQAGIHPSYPVVRQQLASHPSTFVLLASFEIEACVAETVRRQLNRPFARSAAGEEAVIRERFPAYMALPARKIATMRPIAAILTEMLSELADQQATDS